MNYFLSLCFISLMLISPKEVDQNQQTEVLKSVFDIKEFQNYLATPPRFVGTSIKQEILILTFPELKNQELELTIRERSVRFVSEKEVSKLKHNFFITIDEFEIKNSEAHVLLSYQNAKMYYEKRQKLLLDVQLDKSKNDDWSVKTYNIKEVSVSTSD